MKVKVKKKAIESVSHFGEKGGGYETGDTKITTSDHKEPPLVVRSVVRGNRRPMRFVSLHHHSTFSYLDGYKLPEAHVRRATELNMSTLTMTEHGNVDSHTKFEESAQKHGVKPIFGCEVYMPCPWDEQGQRKTHLTLLAKNQEGYRNLLHLVSKSWLRAADGGPVGPDETGHRYKPTVTMEGLDEHKEGLVVLSGCSGSLLFCSLVGGKGLDPEEASFKRGLKVARDFKRHFGENYYIEVQGFPELESHLRANPLLARIAKVIGSRLVGTMDCHYTMLEEAEVQKILHGLRGQGQDDEDKDRSWSYTVGLCPPLSDGAIVRKLQSTGLSREQAVEAVQSSADIGEECNVVLPKLDIPEFPVPRGFKNVTEFWRHKIREGWKFRGFDRLPPSERHKCKKRLQYEVGIIEQKGFENYLLIVADEIVRLKERGIPVGPARGSAAGSLVAFVLRITEVNPLKFPLLVFERFIDINRTDLPDIDIDIPSEVRDTGMLRDDLERIYPSVANVGTFTYYKGKLALDDVARVFRVPKFEVETIKDFLIERSSGDLRASATVQDTIDQFPQAADVVERFPDLKKAELLEGNVRGSGIHAAAYVVASGDIGDVAAIYRRKVGDVYADVVTLDKYDAERQGLLKIDFLGLSTMSAIWDMMRWSNMSLDELYNLPLDDDATYNIFRTNDVTGVFQFDGRAMRSVCQILKPEKFIEIMDCNALSRPGPLHNGSASMYADIKFGRAEPERLHPAFDAITQPTQFQIVYQEQILQIVREVGNFPWTAAAYIRKIISRKIGEQEFNRQWDQFWEGCQSLTERTGHPPITFAEAKRGWGGMITAGSYAFCPTGDTIVLKGCSNGHTRPEVSLAELWGDYNSKSALGNKLRYGHNGRRIKLQQMDDDGRIRPGEFKSIERSPTKVYVWRVKLANGKTVKVSGTHLFMTDDGYKRMYDLKVGDQIACLDTDYTYKQPKKSESLTNAYIDGRTVMKAKAYNNVNERSRGLCENCTSSAGRLEHAHMISLDDLGGFFELYHNPDNIMLLCNPCHKKHDYANGMRKKRDSRGKPTLYFEVVSIRLLRTQEYVYAIEMAEHGHNFVGNGIVHHNNAAHCASYGLLAYWTAWFKAHKPQAFFAASAKHYGDKKQHDMLRDSERHGIKVLKPKPGRSDISWAPADLRGERSGAGETPKGSRSVPKFKGTSGLAIRAGYSQIDGIGPKKSDLVLDAKIDEWDDILAIKGFGIKTVEKIKAWLELDDPFDIYRLENDINATKRELVKGTLTDHRGPLPIPTHNSRELDDEQKGKKVVWIGELVRRNIRDIFEINVSQSGEALDPKKVKDPHLREFAILYARDEDDQTMLKMNRWMWPRYKHAIFNLKKGQLLLVAGRKPRYGVQVDRMWVIEP